MTEKSDREDKEVVNSNLDVPKEESLHLEELNKLIKPETNDDTLLRTKIYPKRWLILVLFTLFVFGNKMQWVQYTVILNIITRYIISIYKNDFFKCQKMIRKTV